MPIKSLVRQSSNFPPIGKLHKGSKKRLNQAGKEIMGTDLKFFRFASQDLDAMATFESIYGNEPDKVDIYLVHDNPEEAFQFWQEEYRAGNLMHRCDDETCVLWRKPDGTFSQEPKPCPGNCKQVGRMFVILPKLMRFAYVTVETHSKLDILQLQDNLNAAYNLFGPLSRIPFLLSRRDREVSYVDDSGKPHKITKSLLYLEPQPDMMKLRMLTLERERQQAAGLLPDSRMLVDKQIVNGTTGEIMDDDDDNDDPHQAAEDQEWAEHAKETQKAEAARNKQTRPVKIRPAVDSLYSDMLDEKSRDLFTVWMIKRYTKARDASNIRDNEGALSSKEVDTIINALQDRKDFYFDEFKAAVVAKAKVKDEAEAKAAANVLAAEVGGIVVPEGELVAA